jgi:spermidine synthase
MQELLATGNADSVAAIPSVTPRDASSSEPPSGPERRDFISIFLISSTLIVFQIGLTRILSVVAWYHFAFLTISMVMLGLGAPGVWFALIARPQRFLPFCLFLSGLTIPAAAVALLRWGAEAREVSVLFLIAFVLPAMLALGSVVCLLLMRARGPNIAKMYGIDLLGAGLGALAVIPLLHAVPTPQLVVGCGLLPILALSQYQGKFRILAAAGGFVILALLMSDLLRVTRSKAAYEETPIFEKWSPTARLAVFDWSSSETKRQRGGFVWGKGSRFPKQAKVSEYWLEQDGSAGTPITQFSGDLKPLQHFLYDLTALGHQVRPRRSAAIIGAGGGRDILSALITGVSDIDAVELNPHTIETVSDQFGAFSGDIYHAPGVHAFADEGRSFLTRSTKKYDLIQISLIDSWAASAAGAFAFAENNLYTTEAFVLYADRLSDTGVVSTSRWLHEMPRLIILARAALQRMNVPNPERHLMLATAGTLGTLLIGKNAMAPEDVAKLVEVSAKRGFQVVYPVTAGASPQPVLTGLIEGDYGSMSALGLSTRPPVDDSPYFFQAVSPFVDTTEWDPKTRKAAGFWFNFESSVLLRRTMFWVTGLALGLFFLPFAQRGLGRLWSQIKGQLSSSKPAKLPRAAEQKLLPLINASIYFAAIGAGFMLHESMLVQRFVLYLGHPSYATTVTLASLLLGMGCGAAISERVGVERLQRLGLLIPILLAASVALAPHLFNGTLGLPLPVRILCSCAMLVPSGLALGLFFPLGMLRFGDTNKPWYWAINGAFGVVASVFSLALSMQFTYTLVGYLSAGLYALACICFGVRVPRLQRVRQMSTVTG